MKKRWIVVAFIIVLFIIFLWGNTKADILDYNLKAHTNLALHFHPHLEIEYLGDDVPIPPNVGISSRGMRVIHTHDSSGELHVETPYVAKLYLRDFFTIWRRNFNSTCLFDECVDENYTIEFFVNGQPSNEFENLLLEDGQGIKIVYRKK
jgi:hypothetical protein